MPSDRTPESWRTLRIGLQRLEIAGSELAEATTRTNAAWCRMHTLLRGIHALQKKQATSALPFKPVEDAP